MTVDRDLTLFHEYAKRKVLAATRVLGPTFGIVRALNTASRFNSLGIMETGILANVARFDHNPVTGASLGLLIEEARTNLAKENETFDNVEWGQAASDVEANQATAPDGTTTADLLDVDDANASQAASNITSAAKTLSASSQVYTLSLFAESNESDWLQSEMRNIGAFAFNCYFDIVNSVVGTEGADVDDSGIIDVGGGRHKCWFTFTNDGVDRFGVLRIQLAESDGDNLVQRNGPFSLFIWGIDLEAGGFPLSYIGPTLGAVVARNSDVISTTDLDWLNSSQTFFAHIKTGNIDNDTTVWSLHDGTADNRIAVEITGGDMHFIGVDGGGAAKWDISTAVVADTEYRIAVAWAENDIAFYLNGSQVGVDSVATIPTVTTLNIGSDHADAEFLNSHFKEDRGYNVRKNNQFLEDLSSGLINESINQIETGFFSISNCVKDPDFVAEMRAEAENADVWATWVGGVDLVSDPVPRGTANLDLNISLIQDEADGSAVWARWAPGTQPENTGNLQLDMVAALNAGFVLTV